MWAVRTLRQGRRDATGELQTRICRSVEGRRGGTCPSGRRYHPRIGLVVLCTSGRAFFLTSEIVAIMIRTCRWDRGKTLHSEGMSEDRESWWQCFCFIHAWTFHPHHKPPLLHHYHRDRHQSFVCEPPRLRAAHGSVINQIIVSLTSPHGRVSLNERATRT